MGKRFLRLVTLKKIISPVGEIKCGVSVNNKNKLNTYEMAECAESMDEVLDKLGSTLISENLLDSEDKSTNFEGLYKNWGKLGSQEERRKEILQVQKSNRNDKLDRFRGIFELVKAVEQKDLFYTSPRSYYRPTIYVAGFNKAANYSNVLMMSEWMIEKPEDFCENWYVVPCPKGVRMLVVATNGSTKFYTKFGHFRVAHRTALPGGSHSDRKSKTNCCVLDGFYDKQTNTFFILDLLAWNNQPMTDGETEFRHYWLVSQLEEISALKNVTKQNEVRFSILPKTPCDNESLTKFMMKFPHFENNTPKMDGLLFYHKRAHYFSGETPLVGWLYPFMVPEVIGPEIELNKAYELEKPEDYVNQADFIIKFEEKNAKKKNKKSRTNSQMDTSDVQSEKDDDNSKPESESKENEGMETEGVEKKSENASTMETEGIEKKSEIASTMETEGIEKKSETATMDTDTVKDKSESKE